jgi:hypothetical protein
LCFIFYQCCTACTVGAVGIVSAFNFQNTWDSNGHI